MESPRGGVLGRAHACPAHTDDGDELRLWLQNRLPGFKEAIRASYKPDDGVYTPHHVCSVLTAFFRDGQVDYASPRVVALFAMIEEVVARDHRGFTPISNAFFTCFLENLSCTPAGEACLPHMGSVSSTFFLSWHLPGGNAPAPQP